MSLRSFGRIAGVSVITLSLLHVSLGESVATPSQQVKPSCAAPAPAPTNVVETLEEGSLGEVVSTVAEVQDSLGVTGSASAAVQRETLRHTLQDEAVWQDKCGEVFYMEETKGAAAPADDKAARVAASAPLANTFKLNSRPGSDKTIYLDFRGQTVRDTAWNKSYGSAIKSSPFSLDSSSAFSSKELAMIQDVWNRVSDDYAPWDVNVTTQTPTDAMLLRDGYDDSEYGVRVIFGNKTNIAAKCKCGGLAYMGIAEGVRSTYYPAWVFTNKLGNGSKNFAEAASHEIGHTLGLSHDGSKSTRYYRGSKPWAPIMGVGYYQPLSQWSKGEYSGATNREDDVSIIGQVLPPLGDSHPSDPMASSIPTVNPSGTGSSLRGVAHGVITSGSDVDLLLVNAAGKTTFAVAPSGVAPNLDLGIRVYSPDGSVLLGSANPTVKYSSTRTAKNLNASLTLTLPPTTQGYLLKTYPVGHKSAKSSGGYSTYGSLGPWTATISTQAGVAPSSSAGEPLTFEPMEEVTMQVGKSVSTQLVATGGTGAYFFSATNLPSGLTLTNTGRLYGTPKAVGTKAMAFKVASRNSPSTGATVAKSTTAKVYGKLGWKTKATLAGAKRKASFTRTMAITGGVPIHSFSLSGKAPSGTTLTLPVEGSSATSVRFAGKISKAGTYRFTLRVKDTMGITSSRTYSIKIK